MSESARPPASNEPLVRCRDLEIGHGGRALLPKLDLELFPGQFWTVIGRNGSGKSTWMKTLLGLVPQVRGRVEWRASGRPKLTYLAQRSAVDELYPLTVRDAVALGTERHFSFLRLRPPRAPVERALDLMGIRALAERPFRELSEGQRQRVLFARLAASEADLALLDEPTSALDLVAERETFELLRRLTRETGMSVVVVTHYVRLAGEFADHAVLLDRDTPAVAVGTPAEVFANPAFRARYSEAPRPMTDARGLDV